VFKIPARTAHATSQARSSAGQPTAGSLAALVEALSREQSRLLLRERKSRQPPEVAVNVGRKTTRARRNGARTWGKVLALDAWPHRQLRRRFVADQAAIRRLAVRSKTSDVATLLPLDRYGTLR
jgi:hypothetical protein